MVSSTARLVLSLELESRKQDLEAEICQTGELGCSKRSRKQWLNGKKGGGEGDGRPVATLLPAPESCEGIKANEMDQRKMKCEHAKKSDSLSRTQRKELSQELKTETEPSHDQNRLTEVLLVPPLLDIRHSQLLRQHLLHPIHPRSIRLLWSAQPNLNSVSSLAP